MPQPRWHRCSQYWGSHGHSVGQLLPADLSEARSCHCNLPEAALPLASCPGPCARNHLPTGSRKSFLWGWHWEVGRVLDQTLGSVSASVQPQASFLPFLCLWKGPGLPILLCTPSQQRNGATEASQDTASSPTHSVTHSLPRLLLCFLSTAPLSFLFLPFFLPSSLHFPFSSYSFLSPFSLPYPLPPSIPFPPFLYSPSAPFCANPGLGTEASEVDPTGSLDLLSSA